MLAKLIDHPSQSITGAALVIAGAGLLSRLVGLVRDRIFAHYFGASAVMDAYHAAFKIPDLIFSLLVLGALSAGFIPAFTRLIEKKGESTAAWNLANNIVNLLAIILAGVTILSIIFAPYLNKLIAPGFNGEQLKLTISFTRIMLLSPLILGLSAVMGGILQSLRQFLLYSLSPIFYNLGIIIGATMLINTRLGINGLAYGVVLGAIMHFLLQTYGAYRGGYRFKWHLDPKNKNLLAVAKLVPARAMSLGLTQLNLVVITILASFLPAGSVAVYSYADNLQGLPIGLIGIPFAIASFPILSSLAAKKDLRNFVSAIATTARQILFLIIPLSVIVLMLRAQIVRVILGTGAFDWPATYATFNTLAFFALGMFAHALIPLLARGFFALEDTKTPFIIALGAEIVTIVFALSLMNKLGVAGLALASSIGATVNALLLVIFLRNKTKGLEGEKILRTIYKISIAAITMALTIQALKEPLNRIFDLRYFGGILGQGFLAGLAGLLVYGAVCKLLKVEELINLQNSFRRQWLRLKNVGTGIDEAEKLS